MENCGRLVKVCLVNFMAIMGAMKWSMAKIGKIASSWTNILCHFGRAANYWFEEAKERHTPLNVIIYGNIAYAH